MKAGMARPFQVILCWNCWCVLFL